MQGAEGIAAALAAEEVEFVAGISGASLHEVADALSGTSIQSISTRHERVAVDIADGYARVSGRVGVAMCVQGPGGANALAGIANAFADSSPVLLLHGQVPQNQRGRGATQEMAVVDLFRPITRWVGSITQPGRIPDVMRQAFRLAASGRPGPVVVELPTDVAVARCEPHELAYRPAGERLRSAADPDEVERAAALLVEAGRPLLYAGAGALWSEATAELVELAELLGAPVMTTLNGKSVFPENHPLALGLGGFPISIYSTDPALHFCRQADVVFAVGCSFKAHATNQFAPMRQGVRLIQADVDAAEIGKNYPVEVGLLGDARLVLRQINEAVRERLRGQPREWQITGRQVGKIRQAWLQSWLPSLTSEEIPINPYRLTWELMQKLEPSRSIVVHDAGAVRGYVCHHYVATAPHTFLGFGGQSTMGWSLGAALGARLARPQMNAVAVIGDGSFGMTGMDIETAARCRIPALIIILNNRAYDIVRQVQDKRYRPLPTWTELDGDYAAIARALGAHAERVEHPAALGPAIERALRANGEGRVAVLDVVVKPMEPVPNAAGRDASPPE